MARRIRNLRPLPPKKITYTDRELTVYILLDLITDIRCADADERPEMAEYATQCREQFRRIWSTRHAPKLDRYGWPVADPQH